MRDLCSSHLRPCWHLCLCTWHYYSLCYHQRPWGYPWSMQPPEARLMSVVRDSTEGQAGVCGLCCCRKLCFRKSMGGTTARTILVSVSPTAPEAMLMSLAYVVATEGYDGVRGLCFVRGLCSCLWSILTPETRWMSVVCSVSRNHA